jgi:hypothetical protein
MLLDSTECPTCTILIPFSSDRQDARSRAILVHSRNRLQPLLAQDLVVRYLDIQ